MLSLRLWKLFPHKVTKDFLLRYVSDGSSKEKTEYWKLTFLILEFKLTLIGLFNFHVIINVAFNVPLAYFLRGIWLKPLGWKSSFSYFHDHKLLSVKAEELIYLTQLNILKFLQQIYAHIKMQHWWTPYNDQVQTYLLPLN